MPHRALVSANSCITMPDIPKLSTTYTPGSTYPLQSQGARQHQQQTSLPSFASLSEHANRTGEPDEMEIAPMSARLSCHSCNQLTPLLRDVALAVAELDDYAQQMSNKVFTRVRYRTRIHLRTAN